MCLSIGHDAVACNKGGGAGDFTGLHVLEVGIPNLLFLQHGHVFDLGLCLFGAGSTTTKLEADVEGVAINELIVRLDVLEPRLARELEVIRSKNQLFVMDWMNAIWSMMDRFKP